MKDILTEWNNVAWYQQGWIIPAIIIILIIAFVASVIWLIDGIHKYGYWLHKEEK